MRTSQRLLAAMMRAVVQASGDLSPGGLSIGEAPIPELRPHEVLIRARASALNRADIMQRMGHYPPPDGASKVLGLEVAGEIEKLGPAVGPGWKVGDRVMALLPGGGQAEYCTADQGSLLPIPRGISFERAAAIPEVFLTAYQCLFVEPRRPVTEGDVVLVHAAASGVGTAALQLARIAGARGVIGTSSQGKGKACLDFGATHHVAYAPPSKESPGANVFAEGVRECLREMGEKGVTHILDPVFRGYSADNAQVLAMDGSLVLIGFLGGAKEAVFGPGFLRKRADLKFSTLRNQSADYKAGLVRGLTDLTDGLRMFEDGRVRPVVHSVLDWEQIAGAHRELEGNSTVGKIVLRIGERAGPRTDRDTPPYSSSLPSPTPPTTAGTPPGKMALTPDREDKPTGSEEMQSILHREDPLEVFQEWWQKAKDHTKVLEESHAMCLSTCTPDGFPSSRMVLLKKACGEGFRFFTNYNSRKGQEMTANPKAALLFYWPALGRQIRMEGMVERLPKEENDAYFNSRPLGSRLAAIASHQSQPLPDNEWKGLEEKWKASLSEWEGKEEQPERPEEWGGWLLRPVAMEFWENRACRLHDRIVFKREGLEGPWTTRRLCP